MSQAQEMTQSRQLDLLRDQGYAPGKLDINDIFLNKILFVHKITIVNGKMLPPYNTGAIRRINLIKEER